MSVLGRFVIGASAIYSVRAQAQSPTSRSPTDGTGAIGAQTVSAFTGRIQVPATAQADITVWYGAPSGISSANKNEAAVQTLSPATDITLLNLAALTTSGAVPGDDSINVQLRVNGNENATLACSIMNGASTCTSLESTIVPAGSQLSIAIAVNAASNALPAFDLLFGIEAT
jgi:hypothetical protein